MCTSLILRPIFIIVVTIARKFVRAKLEKTLVLEQIVV